MEGVIEVHDLEELQEHSPSLPCNVQITLPWERYHRLQSGGSPLLSSELPWLQEQDRVRGLSDRWESQPKQCGAEVMDAARVTPQYVRPKPKWFCARAKVDQNESDKGRERQRTKPSSQYSASTAPSVPAPRVPVRGSALLQQGWPKETTISFRR